MTNEMMGGDLKEEGVGSGCLSFLGKEELKGMDNVVVYRKD